LERFNFPRALLRVCPVNILEVTAAKRLAMYPGVKISVIDQWRISLWADEYRISVYSYREGLAGIMPQELTA
jgi:hypothetical protein